MEAILLESVRLGWGRKLILFAKEEFPGGVAFFLREKLGGDLLPLAPGGQERGKRKRVVFLPGELREGDYYIEAAVEDAAGEPEEKEKKRESREKRIEGEEKEGERKEGREKGGRWILTLSGSARGRLLLLGQRRFFGENLVLFPMGGDEGRLLLRVRKQSPYDGKSYWVKERLSFFLSFLLRPLGVYGKTWVVFEKFCAQAQDNGVAFFRYCQEEGRREDVYFILERSSPAWEELRRYGRHLVPFMSLRHMLLMSLAPLYVASESRYHGYAWRCPPSPLFREIRRGRHKIFFLQHGVTAMKQVHTVFGREGYNPMDYFAVTAPWEQEIVIRHFGYEREQVPITGFARWDGWKDLRGQKGRPYILLAPTWRGYLDGKDDEAFLESPYWRAYQVLLQSQELIGFLEEFQVQLRFHIHPRLAGHLSCIGKVHPLVEILPYDGVGLPGLLMGASALVTDYSSLAYDGAYLERPVVFYRFPEPQEVAISGYVSEEELPGPVVRDVKTLCEKLTLLAQGGFQAPRQKQELFAYRDQNNCRRIAEFLKGEGF